MVKHRYSIETIHHFICGFCARWWSIADFDDVPGREENQKTHCPHCGKGNDIELLDVNN